MKSLILILPAVLLVVGVAVIQADTIHVPSQQPTIQAGIDAAMDGDTVMVADGTYTGDGNRDIDFLRKAIVVMSLYGPENCIIDCEGDSLDPHRAFYFHNGENNSAMVKGFTITHGYAYGDEIGDNGSGIFCNESSPIIDGNIVIRNVATGAGGGIYCTFSSPVIRNNIIMRNRAHSGGAINCYRCSHPIIEDNWIVKNTATNTAGAICINTASDPIIRSNKILGHKAIYAGGIYIGHIGNAILIEGNMIANNVAVSQGGGCYFFFANATFVNNVIFCNSAINGGGFYCRDWSGFDMYNCTIAQNVADSLGGGVCLLGDSEATIVNTIIWGNEARNGFSVYRGPLATASISFSCIEYGWTGPTNIDDDPQFVLPENHDFRLLWGSPCIDSGRPGTPDIDGTISDMGAYFFNQNDSLTLYVTPDKRWVKPGEDSGLTYTVINRLDTSMECWGISRIYFPNMRFYDFVGPQMFTIPADHTGRFHITRNIPDNMLHGENVCWSMLFLPPSTSYDDDIFSFWVKE